MKSMEAEKHGSTGDNINLLMSSLRIVRPHDPILTILPWHVELHIIKFTVLKRRCVTTRYRGATMATPSRWSSPGIRGDTDIPPPQHVTDGALSSVSSSFIHASFLSCTPWSAAVCQAKVVCHLWSPVWRGRHWGPLDQPLLGGGRTSPKRERRRLMRRTLHTAKHVPTSDIWWLNEASVAFHLSRQQYFKDASHKRHEATLLTAAPQLHSKLEGNRCGFNEPHVPSKCSNLLTLFSGLVFVTFKFINSLYPVKSKTIINNVVNRPESRNQNKPGDEDSQLRNLLSIKI